MANRITYKLIFTLIAIFSMNILFAQTEISEIERKRQEFKALLQLMPDEAKDFFVTTESILEKQNAQQIERDEITYYLLDTAIVYATAQPNLRYTYTYDEDGKQIIGVSERFVNGNWENISSENTFYNDAGLAEEVVTKQWIGGAWVNSSRIINEYNDSDALENQTYELWNGEWVYSSRTTFTWNSSGFLVAVIDEVWNGTSWEFSYNELYIRDDIGALIDLVYQEWDGDSWENQARVHNSYNDLGLNDSTYYMNWSDLMWQNVYVETKSYNDLDLVSETYGFFFIDNVWNADVFYEFAYNEDGFLETSIQSTFINQAWEFAEQISILYNEWGSIQSYLREEWEADSWTNNLMKIYTFDGDGNTNIGQVYLWQDESWQQVFNEPITLAYNYGLDQKLFNGYRVLAAYRSILVEIPEIGDEISFVTYPNPASDHLIFRLTDHQVKADFKASLLLSDMTGKTVFSKLINLTNSGIIKVDLRDFVSGHYFITLKSEKVYQTEKIVIKK